MASFSSGMLNTSNIIDGAITTSKLADNAVTIAKADDGTTANKLVALDASAKLPAVDGSALTNVPPGEGHVYCSRYGYNTIVQGTWTLYQDFIQNGNAINDELTYQAFLAAGTYTFAALIGKAANYGIFTVKFDAATIGTIDGYDAGSVSYSRNAITAITVAASALVTISLKLASKNASSTGYYGSLHGIEMWRTA